MSLCGFLQRTQILYLVHFVTENYIVPTSCLFSEEKPLLVPTFKQIIRQGVVKV